MVRLKKRNIIKPLEFNSVYSKIDTTVLYKDCSNKYKKAIKFYKDGKVGCFFYVDSTDKTTIDPRRALMGKFELKNGKIYMNFIARNSQVGRFLLKEKV